MAPSSSTTPLIGRHLDLVTGALANRFVCHVTSFRSSDFSGNHHSPRDLFIFCLSIQICLNANFSLTTSKMMLICVARVGVG